MSFSFFRARTLTTFLAGLAATSIISPGLNGFGTFFLAGWAGFDQRKADSAQRGKLRGRGIATFLEWTGGNVFEERVTVDVTPDGFIEIGSATQAMGQGIATSYAQLAVDVFDVPIERVRIVQQRFAVAGVRNGAAFHIAIKFSELVAEDRLVEGVTVLALGQGTGLYHRAELDGDHRRRHYRKNYPDHHEL